MKDKLIIHPILFTLFPFLFLYAHNVQETSIKSIDIVGSIAPLFIVIISMVCISYYVIYILIKDVYKSALIIDLCLNLNFLNLMYT